jgi:site-specific DNA-cytosine methylase
MIAIVDLFCGGGGFSEGAMQAGAVVVLSIDAWHPAVVTHRMNHPNTPCLKFELGGSIEECVALIKMYLPDGCHFHLHASPPCQALSNASSANPADGLGLVDWVLELVEYMKPDSWSLENVLPLGKHLKARDVPFEKLNSAAFGVPQLRKRVFAGEGWVAKESHSKDQFVSVLDALPHLDGELQIVSIRRKKGEAPQAYSPTKPAHTITRLPGVIEEFKLQTPGALGANRLRDKSLQTPSMTVLSSLKGGAGIYRHFEEIKAERVRSSSHTICNNTPIIRKITHIRGTSRTNPIVEEGVHKGNKLKEFPDGFRTLHEPAYTVCHRSLDIHQKAERVRSLTIEETCTLQGWPGMKIPDTPKIIKKKEAWQIIGNMVCPPVAKAIIEGIII